MEKKKLTLLGIVFNDVIKVMKIGVLISAVILWFSILVPLPETAKGNDVYGISTFVVGFVLIAKMLTDILDEDDINPITISELCGIVWAYWIGIFVDYVFDTPDWVYHTIVIIPWVVMAGYGIYSYINRVKKKN